MLDLVVFPVINYCTSKYSSDIICESKHKTHKNGLENRTSVCYYYYNAILVSFVRIGGTEVMDYKKLIIEMLDKVSEQKLKIIYHYIKAFLGLGK